MKHERLAKDGKGQNETANQLPILPLPLQTCLVERSSQKGILIGRKGSMLKEIGSGARLQMQKLIDGPVYLELFVKVVPHWRQKPGRLAELGYRGE